MIIPIRDYMVKSFQYYKAPKKFIRDTQEIQSYWVENIINDLYDIVEDVRGHLRENDPRWNSCLLAKMYEETPRPAKNFHLEMPFNLLDLVDLSKDAPKGLVEKIASVSQDPDARLVISCEEVQPDAGVAWETEVTVFSLCRNTLYGTRVLGTVVPGMVSIHPAKPVIDTNIISGKSHHATPIGTLDGQEYYVSVIQRALLVVLAFSKLLLATNVVPREYEPTASERKLIRRKNLRRPSYKIIDIRHVDIVQKTREPISGEVGTKKAYHHVRGHFRTMTSERYKPETRGTIWIAPHWRGQRSAGFHNPICLFRTGPQTC